MLTAATNRRGSDFHAWKSMCLVLALAAMGTNTTGATKLPPQTAFTVDAWQTDDGLPQSSVKAIAQTPDGYLWLATFNGLVRFDGVRFVTFDTSSLPGLPNNRLVGLTVDRSGSLWVMSEFNDLARIERGHCRTLTAEDGIPSDGVRWLAEDAQGAIWIAGSRRGLRRLQDGKFVPVPVPPAFEVRPVRSFLVDGSGGAWVQQDQTLYALKDGRFLPLVSPDGRGDAHVMTASASRDGGMWVVMPDRLRKYQQGRWLADSWPTAAFKPPVVASREDSAGNLWLAIYGDGLFRFSRSDGWLHLTPDDGLTTVSMRSLFFDREENLWAGTDGGGLLRVKPRLWRTISKREGLGLAAVHSIAQDRDGRIWFAGGTTLPWGLKDGVLAPAIPPPLSDPMRGVWAVLTARTGVTWIGTYWGAVFSYEGGRLREYGESQGMRAGSIRALLEDRSGAMWAGGSEGVSRISGGQITNYSRAEGLSSNRVQALAEDSHGRLYVGTSDHGINVLQNGRLTIFRREQGLPDDEITSLLVDADDVLWVGTHGGGLSRFTSGRFSNFYADKRGLPARSIGPMLDDGAGNLWMSTNLGILRISRKELNDFAEGRGASVNYVVFDRSDGLATIEVGGVQPGCLKTRDGKLWFGTAKGAAFIDPRDVRVNSLPPPVLFDEVRIDDELVRAPDSDLRQPVSSVTIQPNQRRVEFRFTGLSYAAPKRVQFRYRMEGFDPDWVDGRSERSVSYTRLPPGTYRFHVTARNNDGVWNVAGTAMTVVVAPAFHQTWWFPLIVIAGVAGVVSIVFLVRLFRLKQLGRLRARIAGDLHDEVGSNLGGIILLSEMASQVTDLPEEAQSSLQEINVTAHRTAGSVRDIVWFLGPDFDTLGDMVARMREFARTLLAGIECEFVAPAALPSHRLPLEFRRSVFFAFKEAIHNIRKHAGASTVKIAVEVAGRDLTVKIQDNGCGFDQRAASGGHGLRSLGQRAENVGGSMAVDSSPGKGTRVTFTARIP